MIKRHKYGQHYTPSKITLKYKEILLNKYKEGFTIVDPFVGEGNLLMGFLSFFNEEEAISIIKNKRIKGFDIDKEIIKRLKVRFKEKFKIEEHYLDEIFITNNSLLKNKCRKNDLILTNPPYLARNTCKVKYPKDYKKHFQKNNFLDYYELALDFYSKQEGVWIVPTNFLSTDGMKKIREKLMKNLYLLNVNIYETPVFKDTRISVLSLFLSKKEKMACEQNILESNFIFKNTEIKKKIDIEKDGSICKKWREITNSTKNNITLGFLREKIESGNSKIKVFNEEYNKEIIYVSSKQKEYFKDNILFLRTTDTGSKNGLIGIYTLQELFGDKEPITLLTKKSSRLYVPIFFNEKKSIEKQLEIKENFNTTLNYYREKYNSIFLTNFKNSTNEIQRKRISFKEVYGLIEKITI